MKKLYRKFKIRKYKECLDEVNLNMQSNSEYIVLFKDGTYEKFVDKWDLKYLLQNYDKKPIYYIYDTIDRISVSKEIVVENEEVK